MESMEITKEIRNINPDIQSVVTTMDGEQVSPLLQLLPL